MIRSSTPQSFVFVFLTAISAALSFKFGWQKEEEVVIPYSGTLEKFVGGWLIVIVALSLGLLLKGQPKGSASAAATEAKKK